MIYSKILNYCSLNHLEVSFGSSETLDEYMDILPKDTPFVNFTVKERLSPKLTLENCESIIIIGVPYKTYRRGNKIGILSQNSFYDYHIEVKKHLNTILDYLDDEEAVGFVDTGKLFERGFALKYGLGFQGLNTFIINDELGTYFNIGYILTTKKFETTSNIHKTCYGCYKCIDVCPSQALIDGKCDMFNCVAYLTQKKGLLSVEEIKSIGNFLYGCDLCQKVCPHNKHIKFVKSEFLADAFTFLNMDKKEFLDYKDTSFSWRGLAIIKRNSIYNIFNSNLSKEEKLDIFSNSLLKEKMELPKLALQQVIDLLNLV